ncbi:MAG: hypothetical protein EP344_09130 [Bacteroidetes bacterium]|nr:MAG: hypothetical protein EP344_09130 [Bacteroidota bacterium]
MQDRLKAVETALVIVTGLLALYFWVGNPWLLYAALAIGVIGVFFPWLAGKVHAGWMLLAQALGWFNGRVLLSVVFYVFLTPIAFLAKRLGSAYFDLNRKGEGESYYTDRDHTYESEDLENTW